MGIQARRGARHLQVARLCPQKQKAVDEPTRRRVPAPFSSARVAARICADPAFRIVRPPAPRDTAAAVPATARLSRQAHALQRTGTEIGFRSFPVDLPALWRADDRPGAAHSSAGTAPVAARNEGSTPMIRSFSSRSHELHQPPYPSCTRRTHPSTNAMQHSRVLPARGSHSHLQTCAHPCSRFTHTALATIQNP